MKRWVYDWKEPNFLWTGRFYKSKKTQQKRKSLKNIKNWILAAFFFISEAGISGVSSLQYSKCNRNLYIEKPDSRYPPFFSKAL